MESTPDSSNHPIERVLASMSAAPAEGSNEESTETPVSQSTQNTGSPDSMDTVASELQKAVAEPTVTIEHGQAPAPFMFGFEPSPKHQDQVQAFDQLMGMSAVVRMFAAINTVGGRGSRKQSKPYSLSKPTEYVAAFNEGTDAVMKALTVGPLVEFYDTSIGGSVQKESFFLKRTELHPLVLQRIFSGLACVSEDHMKDLDQVLTGFVSALKTYTCDPTSEQPTLKHIVLINYIRATDLTSGGGIFRVEAFTRRVYITLKSQEWATALEKPGFLRRNEKIKFSMETTITEMQLNCPKYEASKAKYEQVLKLMVGDHGDLDKVVEKGGLKGFGRETCLVLSVDDDENEDQRT
ncbi:hypothetical protein FHETE_5869 [Fusarium heterosporum]|uniref:Uncharacterized protein n=1 Tax=Fusarium heterosporum TaxID=42747 RepID=A0A8H5T9N0_FUSHE|nr:hypothetical protein FHETE_5869 [Fusarium heterosporum]